MRTAAQIIGDAWRLLKEDGDTITTPGLQEAMMLTVLDKANREYLRTFRRSGGNPPLEDEVGYDLIADTLLNGAVSTGAISVDVTDSSSAEATGAIIVWDDEMADFATYTGNAANTLTGVSGISFDHEDNDTVQFLYALPSNYGSLRPEGDNGDGLQVNGIPYWYTEGEPYGRYFTIRGDYLWIARGINGSAFLKYNTTVTTIDDSTDTVNVGEDYDFFLVYRLVEHGRRTRGDNADKVQEMKVEAKNILRQAMIELQDTRKVKVRPIRRRNYHHNNILYSDV